MAAQNDPAGESWTFDHHVFRLLNTAARRHDIATRSRRILASVLQEWQEVGYLEAQIYRIANRAGMSTATLYRLFPDKRQLSTEALRLGHEILVFMLTKAEHHPNPIRNLTDMVHAYAMAYLQPGVQHMLLSQTLMLLEHEIEATVSAIALESHNRINDFWHQTLKSLADQDLITGEDLNWQRCRLIGAMESRTLGRFMWGYPPHVPEVSWQADAHTIVMDFFKLYGTEKFTTLSRTYNWNWTSE